MIWTQFFGLTSVILGLYLSSEIETGTGSMIAVVSAAIFGIVAVYHSLVIPLLDSGNNT